MASALTIVIDDTHNANDHVTGKITLADPAALANISIGFVPSKVLINHVTNVSDYEWNKNMDDGTANLRVTAGDKTLVAADAISPFAGDADEAPGFIIGVDTTLNTAADVLYFTAFR